MTTCRYNTTGPWFKGNVHIHSTASDGGKTFAELERMYADAGYDFLARTDHWVVSDVGTARAGRPLLWLDGVELDGNDPAGAGYHVVALGRFTGLAREMGLVPAMEAVRAQGGLLILAHPHWTGNTLDDAMRWPFDGVEVYNHVCRWLNGKDNGAIHWSAMLDRRPNTLSLAVDDAHISDAHPGWNGGWIMVNAPACTPEALCAALRAGNFYSSCGPQIHTIQMEGRRVKLTSSPIQFARLVGPAYNGHRAGTFGPSQLTAVEFEVPAEWPYAYVELEDAQGRRAWTNPLFVTRG